MRPVPTHGTKESVCCSCHLIFSSVSSFDRHQVGFECKTPDERGLVVLRTRKDGLPVYGSAQRNTFVQMKLWENEEC